MNKYLILLALFLTSCGAAEPPTIIVEATPTSICVVEKETDHFYVLLTCRGTYLNSVEKEPYEITR